MSFTRRGRKLSDSRRQNYRMIGGGGPDTSALYKKRLERSSSSLPASVPKGEKIDLAHKKQEMWRVCSLLIRLIGWSCAIGCMNPTTAVKSVV